MARDHEPEEMVVEPPAVEMPAPVSMEEPFIPPAPVEPVNSDPVVAEADPFREAEMLNAGPPPEKKKAANLFQRMTASSWPRRSTSDDQPQDGPESVPVSAPEALPAEAESALAETESALPGDPLFDEDEII